MFRFLSSLPFEGRIIGMIVRPVRYPPSSVVASLQNRVSSLLKRNVLVPLGCVHAVKCSHCRFTQTQQFFLTSMSTRPTPLLYTLRNVSAPLGRMPTHLFCLRADELACQAAKSSKDRSANKTLLKFFTQHFIITQNEFSFPRTTNQRRLGGRRRQVTQVRMLYETGYLFLIPDSGNHKGEIGSSSMYLSTQNRLNKNVTASSRHTHTYTPLLSFSAFFSSQKVFLMSIPESFAPSNILSLDEPVVSYFCPTAATRQNDTPIQVFFFVHATH